jgi:hypothetical protein
MTGTAMYKIELTIFWNLGAPSKFFTTPIFAQPHQQQKSPFPIIQILLPQINLVLLVQDRKTLSELRLMFHRALLID